MQIIFLISFLLLIEMSKQKIYWLLAIVSILFAYFLGMLLDVMDVDTAQYALISRDMLKTGNYLQVLERGHDYLDKPPLLFWVTSFFYAIFGVSQFVYRIAPFLSTLIGVYATYRLTTLYYGKQAGNIAGLMLGACQAYFLTNHDVRTDTMLTNAIAYSLWQLAAFTEKKDFRFLFGAFVGMGIAMLAKGPIGIMVPVLAFATHFILRREFKQFFRWEWLLGAVIVLLVLSPMMYGLYYQFDAQPEKITNGVKGESGLYFYFWKQSFGRLTGENVWKDDSDSFFFVHTFLWSFLPWQFLFLGGYIKGVYTIFKQKLFLSKTQEGLTLGGFTLPFIAMSMSHFKLPHYIYVVFPLAAMLTAGYVVFLIENVDKYKKLFRWHLGLQIFTQIILVLLVSVLVFWSFAIQNFSLLLIGLLVLMISFGLFFVRLDIFSKLLLPSALTIAGVNILLNSQIYPALFPYQSGKAVAEFAKKNNILPQQIYTFVNGSDGAYHSHTLDFYSPATTAGKKDDINDFEKVYQKQKVFFIYTDSLGKKDLEKKYPNIKQYQRFNRYHITQLTPEFLNPNTRKSTFYPIYLMKF
ncbi:MAG: glycosyltransferase family 39 protein [Cytophagia bacterium]|nr:MAG: glycosyltransferase family 39 protein [Cytophagia bacterium]TAG44652.1 MAG: glycosyltransferase family 39 protein [Cytophagia bacterium]